MSLVKPLRELVTVYGLEKLDLVCRLVRTNPTLQENSTPGSRIIFDNDDYLIGNLSQIIYCNGDRSLGGVPFYIKSMIPLATRLMKTAMNDGHVYLVHGDIVPKEGSHVYEVEAVYMIDKVSLETILSLDEQTITNWKNSGNLKPIYPDLLKVFCDKNDIRIKESE